MYFHSHLAFHGSSLYVYQMLQSNPECCHIPTILQDLHQTPHPFYPSGSLYCQQSKIIPILQRCTWSTGWHSYFSMPPPSSDLSHYRNCKGGVSQNVLAATT